MPDRTIAIYDAAKTALLGGALYSLISSSVQPRPLYPFAPEGDKTSEYVNISMQSREVSYELPIIESAAMSRLSFDQPTTIAVLKSAKEQRALTEEFAKLVANWKANRSASSSSIAVVIDPSYQRIISLGTKALPLILQELAHETDHWFWALRVISNDDPVAAQDRGNVKKMAATWLDWGRKQGYV